MANNLTALNPEFWRVNMQEYFLKESVALGIAATELRDELRVGDTLNQPFASYPRLQKYTKGTDIVTKDVDATNEQLIVQDTRVASFYLDEVDALQSGYDTLGELAAVAQGQLNNDIDQNIFAEYVNAGTTLDAGAIGGTSGQGIVASTANISNIFTAAGRTLNSAKRKSSDRFALIGPRLLETLQSYVGGRETGFGDTVSDNGQVANRFGFGIKLTNNLPYTSTLTISDTVTNGDTVTVNGVVVTLVSSIGSTANNVLIGANAAATRVNLKKFFLDEGTAGTEYIQATTEDRQKLEEIGLWGTQGVVIAGDNLNFNAYGDIVVSDTLSHANNVWSAQKQFALLGIKNSIKFVTQSIPSVKIVVDPDRLGHNIHPWTLFGKKVFTRDKDGLVAVEFDVSSWK